MVRIARITFGLAGLTCAAGVVAQSFNQDITRYRAAQAICAEEYRERLEKGCDEACRAAAAARQGKCLSRAEERYRAALRRELRWRR